MLSIKHLSGGGDDYVEPHVVLIEDTYSVNYKAVTPQPKTINYVTLKKEGKVLYPMTEFPVTTDIYINFCSNTFCSTTKIQIGNCQPVTASAIPSGDNNYILGVSFTAEEANSGQQECEDDTYIYRIKNE